MLARELAAPFPSVDLDTDALEAARMLAEQRLPGLIVLDENGRPRNILPGSQVLRFLIPNYVQDDPSLAHVYDEKAADRLCARLSGVRVRDVLPAQPAELPVVNGDDTAIEIAAVMAGMHSPMVAVVEEGQLVGTVTISALLDRLLLAT
jgi:CBS domain-containing protein